jgi:Spy/CpxP family protein refolding chaperone
MTDPRGSGMAPSAGAPRLVAALVVALALVTGLVLGVAADRGLLLRGHGAFGPRPPQFGGRGPGRRGPPGPPPDVRQHIETELGLSAAQKTQVDSIWSQQMAKRQALDDTIGTRMRALMDSTRVAVDRVLTPEQRQKLAAMRAHRDSARAAAGAPPRDRGFRP